MNELPRRKLREIIAKHGLSIIENPRRLAGILRDHCGEFKREISVLVMAVEEHAVADLFNAANTNQPRKVLIKRLAQRLCDNLALSEMAATWSIESWALALGLIGENELTNEAQVSVNQTQMTITDNAQVALNDEEIIVSANGGGHFISIGEAIKNATPDSKIIVREGIYKESIVLDKPVEIVAEGAIEKTILGSIDRAVILMQTAKAAIRGLTIKGRGAKYGKSFFAVSVSQGELILENCDITSDTLSGVAVLGANANPILRKCRIFDCADSGIYIFDNAQARVEFCDIFRNKNVNIAITQGGNPTIKNCRIFEGENGGITAWGNGAAGLVEDSEIYAHRLANVGISDYANLLFRNSKIYDGYDTGVFVNQNGYATLEKCDIFQNAKAEVGISNQGYAVLRRCTIHEGENSGVILKNEGRATIESSNIYANGDAGIALYGASSATIKRCNIHKNRTVAIKLKEQSSAYIEGCDLRGNYIAARETEHGVELEEKNNRM